MDIVITDTTSNADINKRLAYLKRQQPEYKERARVYQAEYKEARKIEISKLHILDQAEIYRKEKEVKQKSYEKIRDKRRAERVEEKKKRIHALEATLTKKTDIL